MEIVFFLAVVFLFLSGHRQPDKKAIEAWGDYRRQMKRAHGDEGLQFVERKPY